MRFLTLRGETAEFRRRYRWLGAFASLVFFVLVCRLFHLQIIRGEHYYAAGEQNFVRERSLPFTRGIIRDRDGLAIATNRPSNDVYVTPAIIDPPPDPDHTDRSSVLENTLPLLAGFLDLEPEETARIERNIRTTKGLKRFQQLLIRRDVNWQELARVRTHELDLPGVDVVTVPARRYPFGEVGAHAIGYMNEVSAEELETLEERGYRVGDVIGRFGIEKAYETYLRGKRGWRRFVVNARGQQQTGPEAEALLRGAQRREPVPGNDVELTLDLELTRLVDRAFRGQPAGAAVVVEVETGRVLALYSKPAYDPNVMSGRLTLEQFQELEENPFRPRIDKTLYENYFPGSTYKIVTALAALEEGLLSPDETQHCQGWHELGRRSFRCSQAHGNVNLHEAIVRSCNVFFYKLAQRVGMDRIALHARDLGFGFRTGIGLNAEAAGFIPTRSWYDRHMPNQFRIGFTLNSAIGQGSTKVTLLQLAMAYAAVANGGILYVPQVANHVRRPDGTVIENFPPRVRRRIGATRAHVALLQSALWGVVNDPEGTAYEYRIEGIDASGKTGTAQVTLDRKRGENPRQRWYFNRDHAWFAGYAPSDNPTVAAVVLVEHGGQGGKNAAPIGLRILRSAIERLRPERPSPRLVDDATDDRSRRPSSAGGTAPASIR